MVVDVNAKNAVHKQLFDVQPKTATIPPGKTMDIEAFYNPVELGEHKLRLQMFITHGKPFFVNLKGETVKDTTGFMVPVLKRVSLSPVPLGMLVPAQQPI